MSATIMERQDYYRRGQSIPAGKQLESGYLYVGSPVKKDKTKSKRNGFFENIQLSITLG